MKIATGSVSGPLFIKELLDRDVPTVGVVIGASDCATTCKNTLDTLKSLDRIALATKSPVVITYLDNNDFDNRSKVDILATKTISALSALVAPNNKELDSRDISTWINFNRVSSIEPQLVTLSVYNEHDEIDESNEAVSVATLLRNYDSAAPKLNADYSTVGYRTEESNDGPDITCVIELGKVPKIHSSVLERKSKFEELEESRSRGRYSISGDDDDVTDSCLVL
jgi:hypothetical protein